MPLFYLFLKQIKTDIYAKYRPTYIGQPVRSTTHCIDPVTENSHYPNSPHLTLASGRDNIEEIPRPDHRAACRGRHGVGVHKAPRAVT